MMQPAAKSGPLSPALLLRLQQMDEAAWGQVRGSVFAFVHTVIGNKYYSLNDYEDLVQETMLRLVNHVQGLEAPDPSGWLNRVAWNAATDALRRYLSHPQEGVERLEYKPAAIESPESAAQRQELNEKLRSCLKKLGQTLRDTFVAKHLEELEVNDIASRLGFRRPRFAAGSTALV